MALETHSMQMEISSRLCSVKADRVMETGLAPELPEDLYMLIKKVSSPDGRPSFGSLRTDRPTLSYRPSLSASTSSATARTRTPSSASFSSSRGSTASPATTRRSAFCLPPGSTSRLPPAPLLHKEEYVPAVSGLVTVVSWVLELGGIDGKPAFREPLPFFPRACGSWRSRAAQN